MPRNPLAGLPFPPLTLLDQDVPIEPRQIHDLLRDRGPGNGVTVLVRSENGHPNQGGYFFHFKKSAEPNESYELYDFQKRHVASMNEEELILLINHCSGRGFSETSYVVCQNDINLRDDL